MYKKSKLAVSEKRHWVRLARACNNRCIFCLDANAQNGRIISYDEIINSLRQGKEKGCERLVLSGGEPTIHQRFVDIVREGANIGYGWIQVVTNGRMFSYKGLVRDAKGAGLNETTFSIHGHNEALHDRLTGVRGSFAQTIRGLLNALDAGLVVSVDIVLTKLNLPYLKEIIDFFVNLGVYEFDLLQIVPFGRGFDEHREELFAEDEVIASEIARALQNRNGIVLWTNRLPMKYLDGKEMFFQSPLKLYDEVLGERQIFRLLFRNGIDPDCMGERCRYCFIEDFCNCARIYARRQWDGREPDEPVCIGGKGTDGWPLPPDGLWDDKGEVDLELFVDFYIKSLYRVKGMQCKKCIFEKECRGIRIDKAMEMGIGCLKPLR